MIVMSAEHGMPLHALYARSPSKVPNRRQMLESWTASGWWRIDRSRCAFIEAHRLWNQRLQIETRLFESWEGWVGGASKLRLDACFSGIDNTETVFPYNPWGCLIFSWVSVRRDASSFKRIIRWIVSNHQMKFASSTGRFCWCWLCHSMHQSPVASWLKHCRSFPFWWQPCV